MLSMSLLNVSDESDNLSRTCEESRLYGLEYSNRNLETVLRYILIGFLGLQLPIALILNAFMIFLILKFRHLRNITFFLALQLLLIDLLYTVFSTPITIISAASGKWIMGLPFCSLTGFLLTIDWQMRSILMFVIVCDRFCTVFMPFKYPRIRRKVIIPLNISAVLVTVITAVIPVALDCTDFNRIAWYCTPQNGCKNPDACQLVLIVLGPLSNVIGSYVPLVMYIIMFIKARKTQNQISSGTLESEEFLIRKKKERKANVTFLLLFLALFGVTAVPFLFYITSGPFIGEQTLDAYILPRYIFRLVFSLLPIVDPIAIMRNQEVRKALKLLRNMFK